MGRRWLSEKAARLAAPKSSETTPRAASLSRWVRNLVPKFCCQMPVLVDFSNFLMLLLSYVALLEFSLAIVELDRFSWISMTYWKWIQHFDMLKNRILLNFKPGLPEPAIFEISGYGSSSLQIPAPAPTPTPTHGHTHSHNSHTWSRKNKILKVGTVE